MNSTLIFTAGAVAGLVAGVFLTLHLLEIFLRLKAKNDPVLKDILRTTAGKPKETKYYPSMTDEEMAREDGDLQAKLKGQIHPGAKQLENES